MKSHRVPCAARQLLLVEGAEPAELVGHRLVKALDSFNYTSSSSSSSSSSSAASTCSGSSARSSASSLRSAASGASKCKCKQQRPVAKSCCCCPCKVMRLKQLEGNACYRYGQARCSGGERQQVAAADEQQVDCEQKQQESIKIVIVQGAGSASGSAGQHALNARRRHQHDRLAGSCDESGGEREAAGARKAGERCACGQPAKLRRPADSWPSCAEQAGRRPLDACSEPADAKSEPPTERDERREEAEEPDTVVSVRLRLEAMLGGARAAESEPPSEEASASPSSAPDGQSLKLQEDANNNCADFPDAYARPPSPPAPPPPLPPPLPSVEAKWLRQEDLGERRPRDAAARPAKRAPSQPQFIPPQFTAPPEDGANIKPSEYLRRMLAKPAVERQPEAERSSEGTPSLGSVASEAAPSGERRFERLQQPQRARFRLDERPLNRSQSVSALSELGQTEADEPERPADAASEPPDSSNLMGAIRSFDRARHLRPTQVAAESQPQPAAKQPADGALEHLVAASKRDLIAELKESRGLDGIKRLKESYRSRAELQRLVAAMVPDFKPADFLDEVAESEPGAPLWRRQMLAKRAADKSRRECEEKLRLEMEERRLSQVPVWKRQMLAKKAAERSRRDQLERARRDTEQPADEQPAWRKQLAKLKLAASTGNVSELAAAPP